MRAGERYILAIDQSTQGTKGLLFDEKGALVVRADAPHRQLVDKNGWIGHDLEEIAINTLAVCKAVVEKAGIDKAQIVALGLSNQRETTAAWDKMTGKPVCPAIVWQCARAAEISERHANRAELIRSRTGMKLSPYFPAAKMAWLLENEPQAAELAAENRLALGTIDSWLVCCLCGGAPHKTDYSNASRTQLFDIHKLCWDAELCELFGVPQNALPEVCMSDSCFGMTDLGGLLDKPIPLHAVLGDSHAALFGQDCRKPGQIKATYGTGSSVMMNLGAAPRVSNGGLVTSLAWGMAGRVDYVFEGNLNYTGAVMSWLKQDVGLIATDAEATELARTANPNDRAYFVPAFTGLGAPYWDSHATGLLTGITRTTGRAEIAKACLDCIAYQITDLTLRMDEESGVAVTTLRADGGPTASDYLMQLQSDLSGATVQVSKIQELSGLGAAYAAGIATGLYDAEALFAAADRIQYRPTMPPERRDALYAGWQAAVRQTLGRRM